MSIIWTVVNAVQSGNCMHIVIGHMTHIQEIFHRHLFGQLTQYAVHKRAQPWHAVFFFFLVYHSVPDHICAYNCITNPPITHHMEITLTQQNSSIVMATEVFADIKNLLQSRRVHLQGNAQRLARAGTLDQMAFISTSLNLQRMWKTIYDYNYTIM